MDIFKIAKIIAAIMLFMAIGKWSYDYFVILRFVVCGVGVYGLITFIEKSTAWASIFGVIAVLWNPLLPIHLTKEAWVVFDVIGGLALLTSVLKD